MIDENRIGISNFQKGIITVLRCAITQETATLPEDFDMDKAYALAKAHHIYPLIYEGAVRCGVSRALPVMKELFHYCCNAALTSEAQISAIARISEEFEKEKLDYMFFKGVHVKKLYPRAEMRVMGDADMLMRMDQTEQVFTVLERLGYKKTAEDDQEYMFESKDIRLEPHKYLASPVNPKYYKYFGTGWDIAQRKGDSHEYVLSPEDHLLYLVVHFAKHYTIGGIGLRHMLDFWVYEKEVDELDKVLFEQKLKKLNLKEFYSNIRHTLDAWFGDGAWDEMATDITNAIFKSGSYGTNEARQTATDFRNTGGKNAKWKSVLRTIFPPVSEKKYEFPILQKCPWMLPFIWICVWGKILLFKRHRIKEQHERIKAISSDKINEFESHLKNIGLH